MGASDPGQNIVADDCPARAAVTQIGSPPHHIGSRTSRALDVSKIRPVAGSLIVLATMPWCPGYSPVTTV